VIYITDEIFIFARSNSARLSPSDEYLAGDRIDETPRQPPGLKTLSDNRKRREVPASGLSGGSRFTAISVEVIKGTPYGSAAEEPHLSCMQPAPESSSGYRRWKLVGVILVILIVVAAVLIKVVIRRAQPIIRARVLQTLSERFKSKVDLSTLDVSVFRGLEVSGSGLNIYGESDPNPNAPGIQPLISLHQFHFHTGMRNLFRPTIHVDTVYVKGLVLNIPPKQERHEFSSMGLHKKLTVYVDQFICEDSRLLINTSKPGKAPLEFVIGSLRMRDIGPGQPMQFEATLVNPKPVGDIHSTGLFGPFDEDDPRDTPVQGEYSFSHADLGTIKGIGGMLSSTGKYEGTLSSIQVDGSRDTPDFRIARSGHSMPLHTDFHAIVDGTNGDTQLQPVRAKLQNSSFTASGFVVRVASPHGHDIELNVTIDHGRIEDFLQLGVRTEPPVMTGPVTMRTKFSLPPGDADVSDRLQLAGNFHVANAHFSSQKIQSKLDSLSVRSQGKLKDARQGEEAVVPADLQGNFSLKDGSLSFSALHFTIPGTRIDLAGNYTLDGKVFDFYGKARFEAKLSQMTTGWKSILLKPADHFFSKDGAGTEIPFKITGTEAEPHFGLDFRDKNNRVIPDPAYASSARR
jgi:hypothetical protein